MKRHHGGRPISSKRVRRGGRLRARYVRRGRYRVLLALTVAANRWLQDSYGPLAPRVVVSDKGRL